MLAYVFWHWPDSRHATDEYERDARTFHAALEQAGPRGFQRSAVFRVEGSAAWIGGAPAYADWYLVDDFAALEPLNTAAVSGICEEPHARVAHAMSAGAGSLLALRGDQPQLSEARHAYFLTKPRSLPYPAFYAKVTPLPATLWRRQMVLGPTPEFCLLAPAPIKIEAPFAPIRLDLTLI